MGKVRRIPVNKGVAMGKKDPLAKTQTLRLLDYLAHEHRELNRLRNITLFVVAISTALRGVDVVRLKVKTVANCYQEAYPTFTIYQKKPKRKGKKQGKIKVDCVLLPLAQYLISRLIKKTGNGPEDYLFTPHHNPNKHLSPVTLRKMFKLWLRAAGIDPTRYGTHSLRRTIGQFLLDEDVEMRVIQTLKGHTSILTTESYYDLPFLKLKKAMESHPFLPESLDIKE